MKRLAKWLANIVLGLVILVALFAIILPAALSARLAIVYSGSMTPAMPAGSLAFMQPVDTATIQVGDIIAFNPPWDEDVTVSHRVVETLSSGFVTQGDAVEDTDPFIIPEENVTGRVSGSIPLVGYALNEIGHFARSVWGFCLLVVLPALVIFGSTIRDVNLMFNPAKGRARLRKKRAQRLKKRSPRAWQLRRVV